MRTNRYLHQIVNIGAVLIVLFGFAAWLGVGSGLTHAQGLPPRPTEVPAPTSVPTIATPRSDRAESQPTVAPNGRITGTVIDARTGAPVPDIAVIVGDATVTSDQNGNYNRAELPAGVYIIALALTPGQGIAEQGPATVVVTDDSTVVQHLYFRSQPMVQPGPEPVTEIQPVELPRTGEEGTTAWMWMLLGVAMVALGRISKEIAHRQAR